MSSPTSATVLEAALQLSVADRAEVAAQLLESLPDVPVQTPEEMEALLAERIADIDSGRTVLVPSEEAWRLIEAEE